MRYEYRSPAGGHVTHILPVGQYRALCGYAPDSPKAHQMVGRARWRGKQASTPSNDCLCGPCKKVRDREAKKQKEAMYDPGLCSDEEGF